MILIEQFSFACFRDELDRPGTILTDMLQQAENIVVADMKPGEDSTDRARFWNVDARPEPKASMPTMGMLLRKIAICLRTGTPDDYFAARPSPSSADSR